MIEWFDTNDPFDVSTVKLRSLASDLTARDSDDINCDSAEAIGSNIMNCIGNVDVLDVALKKKNQVLTLLLLKRGIIVDNKITHIDATNLFNRLTIYLLKEQETCCPTLCMS